MGTVMRDYFKAVLAFAAAAAAAVTAGVMTIVIAILKLDLVALLGG